MTKLGAVASVQMGYPFRSRLEHDPKGDVVVIQMKDIDDADLLHPESAVKVSLPMAKGHHLLREGDLAFRSRGRTNSAALVAAPIQHAVLAAPMLLIRPQGVLPAYLRWFINLPRTQAMLSAQSEGTSVRMVSKDAIAALDIPLPSAASQRRIVEIASLAQVERALMAQIAEQKRRLVDGALARYARNAR